MITAAACLVLCGALPEVSTPELLVDIDESPSTVGELVGANANGMLVHGLNKNGSRSLWWTPWDGAPFLVIDRTNGVAAAPLGEGFVIFSSDGAGQSQVFKVSLGKEPRVEPLTTVPEPVRIIDSSSDVWWVDPNGTSTTDGTVAGTRLAAVNVAAQFQAGDFLVATGSRSTSLLRSSDGQVVDGGIPFRTRRAGTHVVSASPSLINELGETLVESTNCIPHAGGDTGWAGCVGDGGVWLYATDGTPSGTRARFGPAGNFFWGESDTTSADYHLLQLALPGNNGCTLVTAREGPALPFGACSGGNIFGDVWVGEHSVSSLAPPWPKLELGPLHDVRAAGRRAVFETARDYRLSDGTEAGTRVVPAQWPESLVTAGASPRLISSNGDRALYRTTRGVWVTDGTRVGTIRVSENAVFWNKRVLATEGNALVVLDADGKSWVPPAGTLGVAHSTLIGQDGCRLFNIDDDRRQQPIAIESCVESVTPGPEGALIKTDLGSYFLVRDGRAFELGQDLSAADGFRCSDERCWFLSKPASGRQGISSLDLKSGTITVLDRLNAELELLGASSLGALIVDKNTKGRRVVFKSGIQVNVADEALPLFLNDGRLALLESHGINLLSDGASPPPSLLSFECANPMGLSMTGKTLHALCNAGGTTTLRSGPLEGPLSEVDAGLDPKLPQGDELAWFSVIREDQLFVRVTNGTDSREFPALQGSNFARVREGFVFAGIGGVPDEELWVARIPPQGCGCNSGSEGALLWLAVVALFSRASRRSV